ncbi:NUDIX hydrolase [Allorhizocola rhizosphaerae]|uniref:NUDIX hydrolase n=1 Tax=Allorhizocola rhizosphaerae TaxID=1872709 RepID=UPI000E3E16E0|nr:NUDIX domain-containing protein [Allorhizocola rhizosphaerae]
MSQSSRHSVSVAAVITNDDGKVLVIKRRDNGAWQLPGGVLELDETIEDGVVREVREETGVDVKPTRLTGIYKNMNLGVVALVLRAELLSGQPHPTDESAEVAWWTPDQVTAGQSEAFGIRILDALRDTHIPAIRHHDGTNLL